MKGKFCFTLAIFILFLQSTSLFGQTPEDNAVLNQMWYQRNIDILFSPVKYFYADDAFNDALGGERAKYITSHLLHELGEYSFISTNDSTILHNLEFGLEWAFNNHFSVIAAGKTALSEYEQNKAWYFLGGFGFAVNDWFSGKIIGGILNANSPVELEDNYSKFNMKNIGMSLNLFNISSIRVQYEYYTISLADETISIGSGLHGLTFEKVDTSGLNYLSIGLDFLKLLGVPLTSSIEYYRFSNIKQYNIGTSLSSVLFSLRPDNFDVLTDFKFIGKDWDMFENVDVSLTLFIPFVPNFFTFHFVEDFSRRPLKNGQKIFGRYGISIIGSYRMYNKDLPGNNIIGFGGAVGFGRIWYTIDKRDLITSIYNQNYMCLFYHYGPETYNAPNYEWGIKFGYKL